MFARLLALFIIVPIIELYLFLTLGKAIGLGNTILIIIVTAVLGAWLTKSQGIQALAKFQKATAERRIPHEEVIEGIMILIAGAVLLTPGFLTDTIGFTLLIPPARKLIRTQLVKLLKDKIHIVTTGNPPEQPNTPPQQSKDGEVIDIEVLDN